jgi:hypothetical protein
MRAHAFAESEPLQRVKKNAAKTLLSGVFNQLAGALCLLRGSQFFVDHFSKLVEG